MWAMPVALLLHVPFAALPLIAIIALRRWWPSAPVGNQRHSVALESLLALSGLLQWAGATMVAVLWVREVHSAFWCFDVVRIISFVPRDPGSAMLAASGSVILGVAIAAFTLASTRTRRAASSARWYPRAVLAPASVLLALTTGLMLLWGTFTVLD